MVRPQRYWCESRGLWIAKKGSKSLIYPLNPRTFAIMLGGIPLNSDSHEVNKNVARPEVGYLTDVCEAFVSLVLPKPIAYTPPEFSTHVDHFVFKSGDMLFPVAFEASARRLFCYSARYADGAGSVLFIVGESVSLAFAECGLREALTTISEDSQRHGGVTEHVLSSINTPLGQMTILEHGALARSREYLRMRIGMALQSDLFVPPPLDVVNVNLSGWSPNSKCPCRCVFEGLPDGAGLLLRVQWGRTAKREQLIPLVGTKSESPR